MNTQIVTGLYGQIATVFFFGSKSDPDKEPYQAISYVSGATSCNCPGWTKRKVQGQRSCKHTRMIDAGIAEAQADTCVKYADCKPARQPMQRAAPPEFEQQERGRVFDL